MITTPIQIQLPPGFSPDHESLVIGYLADHLYGRRGWAKAFEAFDLLDQAMLVTAQGHFTSRALYQQIVDWQMADAYLGELLTLPDVEQQGPALCRALRGRSSVSLRNGDGADQMYLKRACC